jgi:hypothetical protein
MSAGEWFAWLALTGIVLGPYFIYEAKGRTGAVIGWAITVPSAMGILYVTYTFLPSWLDPYFFAAITILLVMAVAMSVKSRFDARSTLAPPDALAMSSGSIEVRMIPAPDSGRVPYVQFVTANRIDREIEVGGRPSKLRFIMPKEQLIAENDLPATVRLSWWGKGKLVVKRFTTKGFALDEHRTQGVTVRIETYFKMPLIPLIQHETIGFSYLPASPLKNGWQIAYIDKRVREEDRAAVRDYWKNKEWAIAPDSPTTGSIMIDVDNCAIKYNLSPNAALSERMEFEANYFDNSASVVVEVLLATRDEQQAPTKNIKFVIGGRTKPYKTQGYEDSEYTVELDPPKLGKGWRQIVLSLPDEIEDTWGQDGWCYKQLRVIRLRGKLGVSPIRLYENGKSN